MPSGKHKSKTASILLIAVLTLFALTPLFFMSGEKSEAREAVITVDGELTEQNGMTSIHAGTHTLSVSGLQTASEPYSLKLVKGIWSSGQMKRVSGGITVGADGSFTVPAAGFYTLYITTQSRQTYRTLLYVEN